MYFPSIVSVHYEIVGPSQTLQLPSQGALIIYIIIYIYLTI